MSRKRDILQLIEQAEDQGFTFELRSSGHYKVKNPENGKVTTIASTPNGGRGVKGARASLKRIGFKPVYPPKPKAKEENMALKPVKVEEMPKLGEIAELKSVMNASDIGNDIPMAAYTLWNAVQVRMKAARNGPQGDGASPQSTLGGMSGRLWIGNRKRLMEDLWPGISKYDATQVGVYLSGSKSMALIERAFSGTETLWWVNDEFIETTMHKARQTRIDWWKTKNRELTVIEKDANPKQVDLNRPAVNRLGIKPDADGYFRCKKCSFATKNLPSLYPHLGKLGDREHPDEGGRTCKYCHDVLPTRETLVNHDRRMHKDRPERFCAICDAYQAGSAWGHRKTDHPETFQTNLGNKAKKKNTTSDTDNAPAAPAEIRATPAQPDEVEAPTTKTLDDGKVPNPERVLQQILDELNTLRLSNSDLRKRNAELEDQNGSLNQQIERLRERMRENDDLIEKLRKHFTQ